MRRDLCVEEDHNVRFAPPDVPQRIENRIKMVVRGKIGSYESKILLNTSADTNILYVFQAQKLSLALIKHPMLMKVFGIRHL